MADLKIPMTSRILIELSGGADSMVLLKALAELGYSISAAHVNFTGRSDDDASLLCLVRRSSYSYLELLADTKEYAASHKLNTQSAMK
jgi:tRNA(Ile)-lysidine synthase